MGQHHLGERSATSLRPYSAPRRDGPDGIGSHDAGALDAALRLLVVAATGPHDPLRAAQAQHLRGQIADPLNASLAREAHLEALVAAIWAGELGRPGGVREAAKAALALRFTHGYAAAVPALTRALEQLLALDCSPGEAHHRLWLVGVRGASGLIAMELWDFESWLALTAGFTARPPRTVRLWYGAHSSGTCFDGR